MPEQEKSEGAEISSDFDSLSTKELAYHMTLFDWELFWNVHEVQNNVIIYFTKKNEFKINYLIVLFSMN